MADDPQAEQKSFPLALNADRTAVTISLAGPTVTLTAPELENVIHWLGAARASLKPEVPTDSTKVARFHIQDVRAWSVSPFNAGESFSIALRSDFYGWIRFRFSPEAHRELVASLTGAHGTPPPPGTQKH